MKKNKMLKKCVILSSMENFMFARYLLVLFLALVSLAVCQSSVSADTVVASDFTSHGRIKTVSAGLILIRDGGSDLTFRREVNNEYFGDAVMYKKTFFSRDVMKLMGRIESLDRLNAIIYTPVGKIEIQRYKIKDIIMKVPNKGY